MARPRLSQETRERLLDAGVGLLLRNGYHGTGIKEILDEVGVPKGSFYNYFKSKEDFGAEVIRHYSGWFAKQLDLPIKDPGADAIATLKEFFRRVAEFHQCSRFGCLLGNLGAELGGSKELCQEAMSTEMKGWRDLLAKLIDKGQQEGSIRGDMPALQLADFLFDSFEGSLIRMKVEGSTEPVIRDSNMVLDKFFKP